MNKRELILAQVKSLEAQLRVLKANLQLEAASPSSPHTFADPYGRLRGKAESGEEEITDSLYRVSEKLKNLD